MFLYRIHRKVTGFLLKICYKNLVKIMNMSKLNENNQKEKQIVEGFDLILKTTENIILIVFSY